MTDIKDEDAWLVCKRDLYYRPEGQGYTGIRDHAGRYSYEEAKTHEYNPGGDCNPVTIIKLTDAPEFSKACFPDLAMKHLQGKLAEARAEIERLKKLCGDLADNWASCEAERNPEDYAQWGPCSLMLQGLAYRGKDAA